MALLLVAWLGLLLPESAPATSLRFFGNGQGAIDRVTIQIDNPARPADVGSTDFTLEWWMRADDGDNASEAVACDANDGWIFGNILFDRDVCWRRRPRRLRRVAHGRPGRVRRERRRGRQHDLRGHGRGGRCLASRRRDPPEVERPASHLRRRRPRCRGRRQRRLERGRELPERPRDRARVGPLPRHRGREHDADPSTYPSYRGWIDEIRLSTTQRYTDARFTRPFSPFSSDGSTAALYHLDEGTGDTIGDASGGGSSGRRRVGETPKDPSGPARRPRWAAPGASPSRKWSPGRAGPWRSRTRGTVGSSSWTRTAGSWPTG